MSQRFRQRLVARALATRAEQPIAPDRIETFAEKAHDLDAVRKSVEDAASVGAGLWLSCLFALFYIGIAFISASRRVGSPTRISCSKTRSSCPF